jgi:hypothetical protein
MERRNTAIDWINLILAVLLFISPWVLGYTGTAAMTNALIAGVVIAILAIAALVSFAKWEEWVNLIVGLWVLISPWVLGFTAATAALWSHVVIGIVVAVLAAVELWLVAQDSPPRQMASR